MPQAGIGPAFAENNIPVFLGCDERYLPYAAVLIASLMAHADSGNNYDLLIVTDGAAGANKRIIADWAGRWSNLSLRFIDAGRIGVVRERGAEAFHLSGNFSMAAYYRLFAPELFSGYGKMIYLDVDALVLSDLACLHRVDLEGRMLAGCHDLYLEERVLVDREYAEYNEKALGLKPEQGYFNSGVLVFNLKEIRKYAPGIFMRGLFSVKKPRFHDQDILNSVCAGKVAFLPPGWNVLEWMADPGEESYLLQFGGRRVRDICREARRDMKVLHYAGTKPWSPAYFGDCGAQWWKYAERTPFHRRMREEMRLGDDISWLRRKRRHAWFQVWKAGLFRWFCAGARKRHWREKSHNARTNFRRIQKRMDKAGCA